MFRRQGRPPKARLGKRRKKIRSVKMAMLAIVIMTVIATVYVTSRLENITVAHIAVSGNLVVSEEDLRSIATSALSGTYGFLLPKSNILIFPKKKIAVNIIDSFERIETVTVSRKNFTTVQLVVSEREPFALWCGEGVSADKEPKQCYFLDSRGFIFAQAPNFSGSVFFTFYGKLPDEVKQPIGVQFMPSVEFQKFSLFLSSFDELPLEPVSLTRTYDESLELLFAEGSTVIFGRDQSLATIIDNLQSILESEEVTDRIHELDYIDLRFGNKVYYKFEE